MKTIEAETPMQRMQREALEEQAAADADTEANTEVDTEAEVKPEFSKDQVEIHDMQAAAVAEQAAADAASRQSVTWRNHLNPLLFDLHCSGGKIVNYAILVLILASVFISMLSTLPAIHHTWGAYFSDFQYVVMCVFLLEYLLRVYAARDRRHYITSFYGIIDLLTVLPLLFGSPGSSIMRLARLIRVLKLTQYFPVLGTLMRSVSGATNMILAVIATIMAVSLFAGNLAYMLEPETFGNAFIGTWWSLVTMSTVGYGDLVPHSAGAMVLGGVLIMVGICVVAMMTAVIAVRVGRMVNMNKKCLECEKTISSEYDFCPHCGQDQSDDIDLFSDDE